MSGKNFHRILSLILIIGLVMAGYKYLDWHLMVKAWATFSWTSTIWLLLLPAGYLALKAWRFVLLMRSVEDIPVSTLMRGYAASQSASLLPGGFAARSAILAQAGVPAEQSVGPVLVNSGMDQFVLLTAGIFLAYWYEDIRIAALVLTVILVALVTILCFESSRSWVTGLLEKAAKKFNKLEKMKEFEKACVSMMNLRLFVSALALSVVASAASYVILCIVVGALGFKVEYWPLAAAFVIPTLLGRLSPLPAGAGVTEAGMVAFVAAQTSMSVNEAAAATTLMRIFDVVVPALYGGIIYAFFWSGDKEPAHDSENETGEATEVAPAIP